MCAVAGGLLDWESNEEGADSELGFYRAIMCFVCLWGGKTQQCLVSEAIFGFMIKTIASSVMRI